MSASASQRVSRPAHLRRQTLSGQVCEGIRKDILAGTYAPGAQLNEMELAARFGVSRGPVREALQRLIQEQLLTSEPHRGVFVPSFHEDDLSDIFFVRRSLESTAMQRLMNGGDHAATAKRLSAIVTRMDKAIAARDWPRVAELDLDFHRTFVDAVGSMRLSRVYATVQAETKLCLHMMMGGYSGNKALLEEHRRLADLVKAGDGAACLAELARHFGNPVATLRKAMARREKHAGEAA